MTTAARPDFKPLQPAATFTGAPIPPLQTGLPKFTRSLCPECKGAVTLEARLFEEDGKVWMEKTCPEHGYFRDLYYSDVKLYLKCEQWQFGDGRGLMNPAVPEAPACPADCGLCSLHTSHTGLANLDLTNRCNLTCPICFANANTSGTLYEPSLEQVRAMLQALREEKPVAGRIVQFSGGEPTLYPQFFAACSAARDLGFSHVQAATNGILLADPEFARQAKQAGLTTLYLQFDGLSDDIYLRTRGQ
ncbi:MAG TPA: radical SAM protein, partial [Terriglobales bacterium]|nr:radical SAM protein [Terriglobales bacterium]